MNDFQKPIERHERSPIEQPQSIAPLEKDKKEQREENLNEEWKEATAVPFIFATLFSSIKKIVNVFTRPGNHLDLVDQELIAQDLVSFRDLLLLLCHEDQSHSAEYLQKSSELWHTLLEDFNLLDLPEKKNISFLPKIKIFINEILHFPPEEEHSLGFYLTEHVGREWIPFPFMNLLQSLYKDHQENPSQSALSHWIALLNEILSDLRVKPD